MKRYYIKNSKSRTPRSQSRTRNWMPKYPSRTDDIRIIYFRTFAELTLDVAGNVSTNVLVQDVESATDYPLFIGTNYREVRVLSMKVRVFPTGAPINSTGTTFSPLCLREIHCEPPAISYAVMVQNMATKMFSPCDTAVKQTKWVANLSDARENEFYSSAGTGLAHVIPSSLGGVQLWMDGPVTSAGSTVGTVVVTWKLEARDSVAYG